MDAAQDEDEDDYGEEEDEYGDEEEGFAQATEGRRKKKKSTSRKLWKQAVSNYSAHVAFRKTTLLCAWCPIMAPSDGLLSRRN